MKETLTVHTFDWYEGEYKDEQISLEESTLEALKGITRKTLLNHLKLAIGRVTPQGENKILPYLKVGEITLSLQLNYQLWALRLNDIGEGVESNDPMTKWEFNTIIIDCNSNFDFCAWLDNGYRLLDADGASVNSLISWIKKIYQDKVVDLHA